MSSTKFTPGPWRTISGDSTIHIVSSNGPVAGTTTKAYYEKIDDEDRANAHLIAAAPELYEALQELYADTADYITRNKLGDVHHNRAMQLARSALKKARGE